MKYFPQKLLGHEKFRSMVSWTTNIFFEKLVKLSDSLSYILNVRSLIVQKSFTFVVIIANGLREGNISNNVTTII